ncbi:MAG: DUF393 domain-containing protein [Deltaproteobacteria bacterium]|nr:DUF393 domain-containing protein [Deltaproteobacteria bacterium]
MSADDPRPEHLVLYDGVCGLCDRSVRWLIRRDARGLLRFAPLQGETTARLRATIPGIPDDLTSVVYLRGARVHLRSKAFLYLAWHLRWPWRVFWGLRWFPALLGDLPYRLVAALRYRVFGKKDACSLPAPEERARFLP